MRVFRRKKYQIRLQASPSDLFDGLLSGLSFLLLVDDWDHGDVNMQKVAIPGSSSQLS
jgi:hypothetical protein